MDGIHERQVYYSTNEGLEPGFTIRCIQTFPVWVTKIDVQEMYHIMVDIDPLMLKRFAKDLDDDDKTEIDLVSKIVHFSDEVWILSSEEHLDTYIDPTMGLDIRLSITKEDDACALTTVSAIERADTKWAEPTQSLLIAIGVVELSNYMMDLIFQSNKDDMIAVCRALSMVFARIGEFSEGKSVPGYIERIRDAKDDTKSARSLSRRIGYRCRRDDDGVYGYTPAGCNSNTEKRWSVAVK